MSYPVMGRIFHPTVDRSGSDMGFRRRRSSDVKFLSVCDFISDAIPMTAGAVNRNRNASYIYKRWSYRMYRRKSSNRDY